MDDVGGIILKKITLVEILLLISLLSLICTGCTSAKLAKSQIANQKTAKKMCKNIIRGINNKNTDDLEKYFCERDYNDDDFEDEIEDLFYLFDEEILSYDLDYKGETSLSVRDGKIVKQADKIYIKNIVCGSNKDEKYLIIIERYITNKINTEKEGISTFIVQDSDNNVILRVGGSD